MSNRFRTKILQLSGVDISLAADTTNFLRHDGAFADPVANYVPTSATGSFLTTSQSGQFYAASNPSSYTTIATVDASYYLKSNPNSYSTSGNLSSTGSSLAAWTGITPTLFANIAHNHNYLTGLTITGSASITGLVQFTGIGGLVIIQSGSVINFSGGAGGATTNNTFINSGTGLFLFRNTISSGVSQQFISFPATLNSSPLVVASLHNDLFPTLLTLQVSGANTTGFYAQLSNTTNNTGYYVDVFAANSTGTGMATNVIVNNYTVTGNYITSNSSDRMTYLGLGKPADTGAVMSASGQYLSTLFSGTTGINFNNGNVQYVYLVSGSQSISLSSPIGGGRYLLMLKQPTSGTGALVTWPGTGSSGVFWAGGTAPTLTTGNSKVDLITLVYDSFNRRYYGNNSLNY